MDYPREDNTETFTLRNGIRVVHKPVNAEVAHCGLFINTGSRDELPQEHGLAHFIEHTVFKGTSRRRAYHVLTRMEDVGGEINAFTGKEETCLYSSFLHSYYARAIELLTDIAFFSVFPEKEINKEKTVIIDEINSYRDSPSEEIYDRFEEMVFPDHPLGRDILGTAAHLRKFKPSHLVDFVRRTYNTDQIVFSSVGKISTKKLAAILEKTLGLVPENKRRFERIAIPKYQPARLSLKRNTYQTHFITGNIAYSVRDKRRTGLILLNNLLGGPGMSSRLNMAIREKYGFTYNIDSSYAIYSDTGLWSVYMGTENMWIDRCRDLLFRELKKLRTARLSTAQLHKAKSQLIGQIAISQESNSSLMLGIAKTFLLFNKVDTFRETIDKIEALTPSELLDIANEIFVEDQFSTLIYPARTTKG